MSELLASAALSPLEAMPFANKEDYKAYQAQYRLAHKEEHRVYSRDWSRQKRASNPGYFYKYTPYDNKSSARRKVEWAVRTGKLIKEPCRICGDPNTVAHHENYSKPLEVWWLCHQCHKAIHTIGDPSLKE